MLHAEPGIAAATQYLEIVEEVQDGRKWTAYHLCARPSGYWAVSAYAVDVLVYAPPIVQELLMAALSRRQLVQACLTLTVPDIVLMPWTGRTSR